MKELVKISGVFFSMMIILITILIVFGIGPTFKQANTAIDKVESRIGTTIIYNKDTLMIVDYSILNKTYTLSNGIKVNYNLIGKLDSIK